MKFNVICQRTGLDADEIRLVLGFVNGMDFPMPAVPETKTNGAVLGKSYLRSELFAAASEMNSDDDIPYDIIEGEYTPPEEGYKLLDLAEKIAELSDDQCSALIYFVSGWHAGRRS